MLELWATFWTSLKAAGYISSLNMQNFDDINLYIARVNDMVRSVIDQNYPRFTRFLDESQSYVLGRQAFDGVKCEFFGGHDNADRVMMGIFPFDVTSQKQQFPLKAVSFSYKDEYGLSHRDFLGGLMSLGVTRDTIGDIFVGKGMATVFVTEEIFPIVCDDITMIGKVGVKAFEGINDELSFEKQFLFIKGTVASLRLDCIVSMLTSKSREKACELIKNGLVTINYKEKTEQSAKISCGDIISIRKHGKFVLDDGIKKTRKDRLNVTVKKYI